MLKRITPSQAKLKEDGAVLTFAERAKMIGDTWKALSDEEKKPFEAQVRVVWIGLSSSVFRR